MKPRYVWIVHNNCRRACPHCFCNPSPPDDIEKTEALAGDLERLGIDYRVYATDQMDPRLQRLYDKVNLGSLLAGHRADDGMIELRSDVDTVSFSLHGRDAATHEEIAPAGDFDATVANVRDFRSRQGDRKIEIYTVINGRNHDRLEEMLDFFLELGAAQVLVMKMSYSVNGSSLPADMYLEQDQICRFIKRFHRIKHRRRPMRIQLVDNWGPQYSRFRFLFYKLFGRSLSRSFCSCGSEHVMIKSHSRDVYPCRYVVTEPKLRIGTFDEKEGLVIEKNWYDDLAESIEEPCRSCPILNSCMGGCRAEAIGEKYRREGVIDVFAGFVNCPVALGVRTAVDLREDILSIFRIVARVLSKLAGR